MLTYSVKQVPDRSPAILDRIPTLREIEAELLRRRYRRDPVAYVNEVLGVAFWEKQIEVCQALLKYKRVFVKASHSVGKSFMAGSLVNWFFDCFDPGICITTAPNASQVRDILWKEVRVQRPAELRDALQPKAPRMESTPDHFAVGYTSRDDSGFQGRHEEFVFIMFDECVGISSPFWEGAEGMMTGKECMWLVICNPTDTGSRAYLECQKTEKWHVIEISALDHPNIAAELAGLPVPFPKAVGLDWVNGRLKEWATKLAGTDRKQGDFEFPPGSGVWYRPGALFESKVLGIWPTQGSTSVWSETMWKSCLAPGGHDAADPLVIGCDVARFGDDFTSIIARRGNCVLHHETHNGWPTTQTAGRLKTLAKELARSSEDVLKVDILVDDDGVGGGVTDQRGEYRFLPISGASRAIEANAYPNKRSELWFATAGRAQEGRLDLSRLSVESRALIQRQVMAPKWKMDSEGRRVVEPKAETKKNIGRSPDDADALNLAFAAPSVMKMDDAMHTEFWNRDEDDGDNGYGMDDE